MRELKGKSLIEIPNKYIAFDIETTGLDPMYDEIIEIGAIKIEDGKEIETFSTLIKPEYEIDEFITELTGITNEMVMDAPKINEVLPKFMDFIKDSIILGYNVNFDINFIYDNLINEDNNPNLLVAFDVRVIEKNKLVISVNEMVNTQKNIQYNHNVVLTAFNEKYEGLRMFGTAEFYSDGEYYELCRKTFFGNGEVSQFGATKPKGAIVVTVEKVAKYV